MIEVEIPKVASEEGPISVASDVKIEEGIIDLLVQTHNRNGCLGICGIFIVIIFQNR